MHIPFVVDGNITITQIPDPNVENLVYATWGLVIVTLIGIGITAYFTRGSLNEVKKSNELTRKEIIYKLKPDLKLGKYSEILNQPDPLNPSFRFVIQHFGGTYIDNLEVYGSEHYPDKQGRFVIEDFVKKPDHLFVLHKSISSLIKSQETQQIEYIPTGNNPNVIIILWIKFEFLDGEEKTEVIHVFNFTNWKLDGTNTYPKKNIDKMRNTK